MSRSRTPSKSIVEVAGVRVEVTRKRVKNLNLRVHPPDGDVSLSAPLGTPQAAIDALIRQRLEWIHRHRDRLRSLPRPTFKEYLSGETVAVLGEERALRFVSPLARPPRTGTAPGAATPQRAGTARVLEPAQRATTAPPRPDDDPLAVTVSVPLGARREERKRALESWLRREAKREFAAEVARWEPRMGVRVAELRVRRMKTRWGTCNPTAGRVWLNLALIERPRACLEYVVVHELAHLLVADHSPAFWAVVARHLPQWRRAKALLAQAPLWLDEHQ